MIPAIKNFTQTMKNNKESSETSFEFFNTEGTVGASIQGIAIAMEEEKSMAQRSLIRRSHRLKLG